MDGCKPCPVDQKPPEVVTEADGITLKCHHGYVASGSDLDQAVSHWNRFIYFIKHEFMLQIVSSGTGSANQSPCLYCMTQTESRTFWGTAAIIVTCATCHLVKYEKRNQMAS